MPLQFTANTQKVPPDGGWGWMIVIASAICNIVVTPTIGSFGLIFAEKFVTMKMSATDISFITNLNAAFAMSMGLINGPLLRRFGYRKVSLVAGGFVSFGMVCTAFSDTFVAFIVFYGLITAAGLGLSVASFSLALNSYFTKRRNRAVGITMTLTGLGPIFYPQLITMFLVYYGVTGCVLLLAGMCMHIFVASMMLQPVQWHLKERNSKDVDVEFIQSVDPKIQDVLDCSPSQPNYVNADKFNLAKLIEVDHNIDAQSIYGIDHMSIMRTGSYIDQTLSRSLSKIDHQGTAAVNYQTALPQFDRSISHVLQRRISHEPHQINTSKPLLRWFETGSVDSVHLGSSVDVFDEDTRSRASVVPSNAGLMLDKEKDIVGRQAVIYTKTTENNKCAGPTDMPIVNQSTSALSDTQTFCTSCFNVFFDLDIIRDRIYLNIMLGMALSIFADLNFSILTPFIFNELNYSTIQIATFLSTLALADIIARFIAPFIGDRFEQPPRIMYMLSLFLLIMTRMSVFLVSSYQSMMIVCVGLGVAKGVRTVYMHLVIPAYVPIERLAAASGLQMVVNGLIIISLGPVVGLIRDWSKSYAKCILFLNIITVLTLAMWSLEFLIIRYGRSKTQRTHQYSERTT